MDDRKRYPRRGRENRDINTKIKNITRKEHRRVKDFCHKTSKMLIDFAIRNRVGRIEFDGSRRGFLAEFRWFDFAKLIEQKAEENNIKFISSGELVEESTEALATSQPS